MTAVVTEVRNTNLSFYRRRSSKMVRRDGGQEVISREHKKQINGYTHGARQVVRNSDDRRGVIPCRRCDLRGWQMSSLPLSLSLCYPPPRNSLLHLSHSHPSHLEASWWELMQITADTVRIREPPWFRYKTASAGSPTCTRASVKEVQVDPAAPPRCSTPPHHCDPSLLPKATDINFPYIRRSCRSEWGSFLET